MLAELLLLAQQYILIIIFIYKFLINYITVLIQFDRKFFFDKISILSNVDNN